MLFEGRKREGLTYYTTHSRHFCCLHISSKFFRAWTYLFFNAHHSAAMSRRKVQTFEILLQTNVYWALATDALLYSLFNIYSWSLMLHCLGKFKVAYKISFACGFCQNLEIVTFTVIFEKYVLCSQHKNCNHLKLCLKVHKLPKCTCYFFAARKVLYLLLFISIIQNNATLKLANLASLSPQSYHLL